LSHRPQKLMIFVVIVTTPALLISFASIPYKLAAAFLKKIHQDVTPWIWCHPGRSAPLLASSP